MSMLFSESQERKERDQRCKEKDKIVVPHLRSLDFSNPACFRALLMPNKHGRELRVLRNNGVPCENLFLMENKKPTFDKMREKYPRMIMTPNAMDSSRAVRFFDGIMKRVDSKFNLVYLDFCGAWNGEKMMTLFELFRHDLFAKKAMLIVTIAKTQPHYDYSAIIDALADNASNRYGYNDRVDIRYSTHFLASAIARHFGRTVEEDSPKMRTRDYDEEYEGEDVTKRKMYVKDYKGSGSGKMSFSTAVCKFLD